MKTISDKPKKTSLATKKTREKKIKDDISNHEKGSEKKFSIIAPVVLVLGIAAYFLAGEIKQEKIEEFKIPYYTVTTRVNAPLSGTGAKTLNPKYLSTAIAAMNAQDGAIPSPKETKSGSDLLPDKATTAALGVYTFSNANNITKLAATLEGYVGLTPKASKPFAESAIKYLKNPQVRAATLAFAAGSYSLKIQEDLPIDLKYKLLIAIGVSLLVYFLMRALQKGGTFQ